MCVCFMDVYFVSCLFIKSNSFSMWSFLMSYYFTDLSPWWRSCFCSSLAPSLLFQYVTLHYCVLLGALFNLARNTESNLTVQIRPKAVKRSDSEKGWGRVGWKSAFKCKMCYFFSLSDCCYFMSLRFPRWRRCSQ